MYVIDVSHLSGVMTMLILVKANRPMLMMVGLIVCSKLKFIKNGRRQAKRDAGESKDK